MVLTDHPWSNIDLERAVIEEAGFELVAGGVEAASAKAVEAMIVQANPKAIMTCWAPVTAAAIERPDDLRIVARLGVGLDNIDVSAASRRGAWVTNVPDYCVTEVAEHTVGLALSFERGITALDREVKTRGWHAPTFVPRRVASLTIGVIGYGRIGRASAAIFRALGCRVLAYSPHARTSTDGVEIVPLAALLSKADIIVLHAPLTVQTRHMVDHAFIAACERRPLIVNVSRGGLIDNTALEAGLESGALRGAALDVVEGEPDPPASILTRTDVVITPHIGYSSDTSLKDLRHSACNEVVRVLRGEAPVNACNSPARRQNSEGVPLPGGVSSDIRIIDTDAGPVVVKTALPKLKVSASWLSDPARSETEVDAIRAAADLIGHEHVPTILWSKPDEHSFAMRPVDPRLRNWKQSLLAGHVDLATASAGGDVLGRLHGHSAADPSLAHRFASRSYFEELRLTPFFRTTARRLPHLGPAILAAADAMGARRTALVHGDYTPKNILADGAQLVVLDFEVAHWGDPRFDIGSCLSHLMLKAARRTAGAAALASAADTFLQAYHLGGGTAPDDADLVVLTGCLILARTDGDSPVDYLEDLDIAAVRRLGEGMVMRPAPSIRGYLNVRQETV